MGILTDESAEGDAWNYADEQEYGYVKLRHADRQKLLDEMANKKKALKDIGPDNPLYHRIAVSAEMARMRADMAYIVARNDKLEELLGTVSFLHQRLDIVEGAYSHVKMLAEASRIDYAQGAKALLEIKRIKEELTNAVTKTSHQPDGEKSNVLPRDGER